VTDLVRIWVVPVDAPAACDRVLDENDRARAAAFLDERDRQRFTIAHGTLRILVGRELGVPPEKLSWTPGRYGKPQLVAPWSGLHTSLSHSGDLIAYVAAGRHAWTRANRFARLWVRKEAVVKAAGGRLWPNLKIPVRGRDVVDCIEPPGTYRVAAVMVPDGYRAAVALAGPAPFAMQARSVIDT
jgi:4'-phosphopantetheinyl transferase